MRGAKKANKMLYAIRNCTENKTGSRLPFYKMLVNPHCSCSNHQSSGRLGGIGKEIEKAVEMVKNIEKLTHKGLKILEMFAEKIRG